MASKLPLLKISSNIEISQSNRKNLPTENESSLTSQKIDGQQLDVSSEKNADTETTKNGTLAGKLLIFFSLSYVFATGNRLRRFKF